MFSGFHPFRLHRLVSRTFPSHHVSVGFTDGAKLELGGLLECFLVEVADGTTVDFVSMVSDFSRESADAVFRDDIAFKRAVFSVS